MMILGGKGAIGRNGCSFNIWLQQHREASVKTRGDNPFSLGQANLDNAMFGTGLRCCSTTVTEPSRNLAYD